MDYKPTKNLSQDNLSPGRNVNPELPEYEAGVLTTQPRCSVKQDEIYAVRLNDVWTDKVNKYLRFIQI
jgi:hypothetical protein